MSKRSAEKEQMRAMSKGSAQSSGALPPCEAIGTSGITDAPAIAAANAEESVSAAVEHLGAAYHKKRSTHIIVDTTSDYNVDVLKRMGVEVIPFRYVGPEGEREDDLWTSQTPHEFYEYMRKNPDARFTTQAVTPGAYYEVFERAAKEGRPTLYLCLSEGLSSTINAARQASEMIAEKYPDFELYILDNCCDSASAQLLAIEVVRLASMNLSAKELYAWAQDARYFVQGYFTLDSLHWLGLGGRIPPAAAQLGGKLDMKPELSFDTNGSLTLRGVCRGRKKALRAILQDFRDNYAHDHSLPIAVVSADAEKDADWVEAQIRKEKGCEDVVIIRSSVSPVLGSHVGPGMVAVCFWGTDRREKLSLTDRIARRVRKNGSKDS